MLRAVRSVGRNNTSSHHIKNRLPINTTIAPVHSVTTFTQPTTNPAHKNGHPLLLLWRSLPRYIHPHRHQTLPLSIQAQPTNNPRFSVSVLLINAIAVLSEDRFLARSTSPPTEKEPANPTRTLSTHRKTAKLTTQTQSAGATRRKTSLLSAAARKTAPA